MGDLGSLASKPVMEGKSVLFKRFADIDSIDIEIIDPNPIDIGYKHAAYFEMSALEYVESFL